MKIRDIKIENYKGFKNCDLTFHPNINVFIGSNASGKTTLLTAILKSLYSFTGRFVSPETNGFNLTVLPEDIHYKDNYAHIFMNVVDVNDFGANMFSLSATVGAIKNQDRQNFLQMELNNVTSNFHKKIQNGPVTIPIIKFYPANRGSITYNEVYQNNTYLISQLETWANIYQNNLSYSKFFHWFFENETDELRLQRDFHDFNVQSPALRDVRKALNIAFEKLGYGNYSLLSKQIKREGNSKLLPALFLKDIDTDKIESLDSKSDGEKAIITLIADIAYNLSIAKEFLLDENFLNSPGIVIIDEIENHLHPKWQREILPILTELFPNIQFFIATHSPQIVASVPSESVFICDNFTIKKVSFKTFGEDTNSILNEIFNTTDRPKQYIDLIQKFDDLIDQDASVESLECVIQEIMNLYEKDSGLGISNLIDDLNIRLSAYKFDKEYDQD